MSVWPQKMFTKCYHVDSGTSGEWGGNVFQGHHCFERVTTSIRSHPSSFFHLHLIRWPCRNGLSSLFLLCCGSKVSGKTNWKVGTDIAIKSGKTVIKTGETLPPHSLSLAELQAVITYHHTYTHPHVAFVRKGMTAFLWLSSCPFSL